MRLTVGTAGHIDHGKTALVRALTGIDCDRLAEEKRRGITIDLGFAHLEADGHQISFVDVPGHERFVRNALAGLGGIRAMMLVVAADEGVKPQTREHLQICALLEIPAGIVVLSKADVVGEDLLELAQLELEEELRGTPFEDAPIVPASSVTGQGLDEIRRRLLELASREEPDASLLDRPARLPIDRAFHLKGLGVVVTGTLAQGRVRPGDVLEILPGAREVRVRSVQVHGVQRERADAGERVSLQLAGAELGDVTRGSHAVEPDAFLVTKRLLVRARLLPEASAVARSVPVRFHLYSSERVGRMRPATSGARLEPGAEALCEIVLDRELVAARGDHFVVRRPSPQRTLGGGRVLDPAWPRLRGKAHAAGIAALESGDDGAALRHYVDRTGEGGAELGSVSKRFGEPRTTTERRLRAEVEAGRLLAAPAGPGREARWLTPAAYRRVRERAGARLRDYFARHPMTLGMPKAEAITAILGRRAAPLADVYLSWLRRDGTLRIENDRLVPADRKSALGAQESSLAERIAAAFDRRLAVPSLEEIRAEVDAAPKIFEGLLEHLVARGDVVRLPSGLFVGARALAKLRADVLASGWERFGVGEFKDCYGLSRKWAIPLLEYLDAQGVTRRVGDDRQVVRPRA